jgi:AraC-like DNA-binding protein
VVQTEVHAGVPSAALRPYVKRYTGFLERSGGPVRRRELPFAGVAVILSLEDGWLLGVTEDAPMRWHDSFVGGIIDQPAVSEHAGRAHALQFDLTPLGAAALFGVPGGALAGRIVAFDDMLPGRMGALLVEKLAGRATWHERFALLDAWIARRIAAARPASPDVEWAWRRIVASSGAVPIATLVEELGCSRRHLSARFGQDVGMAPKLFARMVRFERAVERLRHGDEELGVIAVDCGYYDQAHFNRDVRAFAGIAPGALMAERHAGGFVF